MSDDRIFEFMAQVSEFMRLTDERAEQTNRNFERLITVMHDGFERVTNELAALNARVNHLTERVDRLTEEVAEIKQELKEVKAQIAALTRRLNATFDQTGRLTEQTDSNALRVSEVEQALIPTNAELHQRVLALEQRLDKAA